MLTGSPRRTRVAWLGALLTSSLMWGASPAAGEPGWQKAIDVGGPAAISDASHGPNLFVGVGREVVVLDSRSDSVIARYEVGPRVEEVTVDAAHKRIFVLHHARGSGPRGALAALSFDGDVLARTLVGNGGSGLDVEPSSGYVYVANWNSQNVSVHDADTLERVARIGGQSWLNRSRGWPTDVVVDRRLGKAFVSTTEGYLFTLDGTRIVDRTRVVKTSDDAQLELDPRRHLLYLTSYENPYIVIIDSDSSQGIGKLGTPHLSPEVMVLDHKRGVAAILGLPRPEKDADGMELRLVDIRTGSELGMVPLDLFSGGIASIPGSWRFFVGGGEGIQIVALDGQPPKTDFSTEDGAVLERDTPLEGTVADDESGVRDLTLEVTDAMGTVHVKALLECSDARTCSWTMPPPEIPGTYRIRPIAMDRAKNLESETAQITVTWMP